MDKYTTLGCNDQITHRLDNNKAMQYFLFHGKSNCETNKLITSKLNPNLNCIFVGKDIFIQIFSCLNSYIFGLNSDISVDVLTPFICVLTRDWTNLIAINCQNGNSINIKLQLIGALLQKKYSSQYCFQFHCNELIIYANK